MLQLVTSPNPVLLETAAEVDPADASLRQLSEEMLKLMYEHNGIGLAGPQVGASKRIIVIDVGYDPDDMDAGTHPHVLINPEFISRSAETEDSEEGCLSCPGISAPVLRHAIVKVKYVDLDGQEHTIEAGGLLSHCLQHEIDHLDGKTLFQTAKPEVRLQLLKEYGI